MSKKKYPKPKLPKGRAGRDTRDGISDRRIAWGEKVAAALQPRGTEKEGLWFTHASVRARMMDQGFSNVPERLSIVLRGLVKSGYLERALRTVKGGRNLKPEYIYRRTSKTFKAKIMGEGMKGNPSRTMQKAFQLRLDHARLPKWFRDMMV